MEDLTCPHCNKPISFWNFIKTSAPLYIRCSHCSTQLKPENMLLVSLLLAVAMIIGLAVMFHYGLLPLGQYIALATVLFVIIELFFWVLLRVLGLKLVRRGQAG